MISDVEIARMGKVRLALFMAITYVAVAWDAIWPYGRLRRAQADADAYRRLLDEDRKRADKAEEKAFIMGYLAAKSAEPVDPWFFARRRDEPAEIDVASVWADYIESKSCIVCKPRSPR